MKYREILLEQLKLLPYFNKETISQIGKQYGLKSTTVDSYISRSLARKDLIPLKNGLYISADFYHKNKSDISYSFYLANVLRTPSYISTWAALQYYNLVTEMVQAVTLPFPPGCHRGAWPIRGPNFLPSPPFSIRAAGARLFPPT